MATVSPIRPLPADVLSQIRSSVTISSLNDVVLNLAKNSLDGNAASIDVTVDYGRGSCIVEDDGIGIEPLEFLEAGGLGKLHHTSKYSQHATTHGGRGSFIALLSALSLISITSHHHKHRSHNSITMHHSKIIARQVPTSAQHRILDKDHGTRVSVRDLFGSMPVRVKQRTTDVVANEKDWQSLRKLIVGLLLAWPSEVSVTMRNILSGQNLKIRASQDRKKNNDRDASYACSILSQALFINPSEKGYWVSTTGSTSALVISGTMSTEPCPHKNVQFLSYHIYPMTDSNGGNILYDHINRIFADSSFGNEEEDETVNERGRQKRPTDARYKQDGYTTKQLKGSKKGTNRWPMFCLQIKSRDLGSSLGEEMADKFLDERKGQLASVIELVEQIVVGFLKEHNFRVRTRNSRSGRLSRISVLESTKSSPTTKPVISPIDKGGLSSKKQGLKDFATEIKMPSFSREMLANSESPFDTWTRVKRGHVRKAPKFDFAEVPTGISAGSNLLSTAAGISFPSMDTCRSMSETPAEASGAKSLPLIAMDGKVARLPFDFSDSGQLAHQDILTRNDAAMEPTCLVDQNEASGDDLVAWVNPASKEKSLICRRTGMAITSENSKLSQSSKLAPKIGRLVSVGKQRMTAKGRMREEPGTWISGLINSWENPVYAPAELPIPQVSIDGLDADSQKILKGQHHNCTHVDIDKAFRQSSGGLCGRLSKDALRNAEVVSQVDRKFILIKMSVSGREDASTPEPTCLDLLVLVDQHAADERCRIEELFQELCENKVPVHLEPPLSFEVSEQELLLFRRDIEYFRSWGIAYETHDKSEEGRKGPHVTVIGLPSVIVERCRVEPSVLNKLLRTEIWVIGRNVLKAPSEPAANRPSSSLQQACEWYTKLRDCPESMLDMMNSRSCRSAIMFNDELNLQQCQNLMIKLSRCAFPFQCAHGRPSMIPLVDMSVIFNNLSSNEPGT